MIKKHPDSAMLGEYTSGALSVAPTISITTHLQFCESCRRAVESLTKIGGELLEGTDAIPVSEDLLDLVLACIDEPQADDRTQSPSATVTNTMDEVGQSLPRFVQKLLPIGNLKWRSQSPSLKVAALSVGETNYEMAFHKIKAGGKAPEHGHNGTEITVVLKGSFSDEDDIYHPGDFIVREKGDIHRPLAAQHEECICLSVLAAPIRLTGIKRVLNPFLSFSPS